MRWVTFGWPWTFFKTRASKRDDRFSVFWSTILSRSEHCTAAFFAQGAKNYTDVKLDLLYRLILWTYIIFVRKNNFLSPSVYCPDTSKRVPWIVTTTETEWRNRFVRDWIETKRAKNLDALRDLNEFFFLNSLEQRDTDSLIATILLLYSFFGVGYVSLRVWNGCVYNLWNVTQEESYSVRVQVLGSHCAQGMFCR